MTNNDETPELNPQETPNDADSQSESAVEPVVPEDSDAADSQTESVEDESVEDAEQDEEIETTDDASDSPAASESVQFSDFPLDLDIDAALAALGSLPDVVAEREAEERAERARIAALKADEEERREAARIQAEERARWKASYHMARPPMMQGQKSSALRLAGAAALIGVGAALTALFTLGQPYDPLLPVLIVLAGVVLMLVVYWLAAGRWSRGALFTALTLALAGGVAYWSQQGAGGLNAAWPMLVAAVGGAAALTGLLARPASARLVAFGLALILGGVFTYAWIAGLLTGGIVSGVMLAAPYVLIVALIVAVLPLILRRRA